MKKNQLSIEQVFFQILLDVHLWSIFLAQNHNHLDNKTVNYFFHQLV